MEPHWHKKWDAAPVRSLFIWVMYCVAKPSKKAADAEGGRGPTAGREGGRTEGGRRAEGVSGCKEGKEREGESGRIRRD